MHSYNNGHISGSLGAKYDDENKRIFFALRSRTRREIHRLFMIWTPSCFILFVVQLCANHFRNPDYLTYLSSLIQDPPIWLIVLSSFQCSCTLLLVTANQTGFYTLSTIFAHSIGLCLQTISYDPSSFVFVPGRKLIVKKSSPKIFSSVNSNLYVKPTNVESIDEAVQKYHKLETLTQNYNELFQNLVFFDQLFTSIVLCQTMYVTLNQMEISSTAGWLIFAFTSVYCGTTTGILLSACGSVLELSTKFTHSWLQYFSVLADSVQYDELHRMKLKLKNCLPFGFSSGRYYTIGPGTVLTFFSIMSSYLIILFQLYP